MNSDSKGAPLLYARTLPPPQPQQLPARKPGETRRVEVNGRLVKLVTIARPAAVPRPVDPKPLQPAAVHPQPHTQPHTQPQLQALPRPQPQSQPSTNETATALGDRQVQLPAAGQDALDDLLVRHLDYQAQGTALCSFTEAILDMASFHDKRAGGSLFLSPGAAVKAWPPTPEFMGRVFTQVLRADAARESKGQATAAAGLAGRLVHELLQSLLVPAQLLPLVEQLGAVEPDDPKYAQAQAAQCKVLADHGKYELPRAIDRIVHALMLQTRGTPHKDAVDRALVAMLATGSQRLTPESFKRLAFTVQAGMEGKPLADGAPGLAIAGK